MLDLYGQGRSSFLLLLLNSKKKKNPFNVSHRFYFNIDLGVCFDCLFLQCRGKSRLKLDLTKQDKNALM